MSGRREEILDAALAIADEHGIGKVSMRALAERVGVTPMALYRHVSDKAELLDGMVGRLLAGLLPPDAGKGQAWHERLTALGYAVRAMARRHPWAAGLLFPGRLSHRTPCGWWTSSTPRLSMPGFRTARCPGWSA